MTAPSSFLAVALSTPDQSPIHPNDAAKIERLKSGLEHTHRSGDPQFLINMKERDYLQACRFLSLGQMA